MKFNKLYSAVYHDDGAPFDVLAKSVVQVNRPEQLDDSDGVLVVWGGADIHPEYYKHPMHSTTHPAGMRDRVEWGLVQAAIERGIPIIGICRGAQMLCAAAGGFLIQDVRGHMGTHFVATHDNDMFTVNSIHHQMMAGLEKVDHTLVAWAEPRQGAGSYSYKDDQQYIIPDGWKEPEFVYFPKINGYAIQWHPEAMNRNSVATKYVLKFITEKEEARGSYAYKSLA